VIATAALPAVAGALPPAGALAAGPPQGDFLNPGNIAVSPQTGDIYVADTGHGYVLRFNSSGAYLGQFHHPPAAYAPYPQYLAMAPSGDVYVSDQDAGTWLFSASGSYLSTVSGPNGGVAGQVAVDPSTGWFYIVNSNTIQKFDAAGNYVTDFYNQNAPANIIQGLAVDPVSHDVYASLAYSNLVEKFDSAGNFLSSFGTIGNGPGQWHSPGNMAVDGSANLYVADPDGNRVLKFDSSGRYLQQVGRAGSGKGEYQSPYALAVDASGNLYVLEWGNHDAVEKFSPAGSYIGQFAGDGTSSLRGSGGSSGATNSGAKCASCVVPRLVGLRLSSASQRLRRAHCLLGRVRRMPSTRRTGIVLSQNPKPGARSAAGGFVSVAVSQRRPAKGKK
jgi:DNA-binding beta-propeller fold protein YncE